jgi:hypothetical protein
MAISKEIIETGSSTIRENYTCFQPAIVSVFALFSDNISSTDAMQGRGYNDSLKARSLHSEILSLNFTLEQNTTFVSVLYELLIFVFVFVVQNNGGFKSVPQVILTL